MFRQVPVLPVVLPLAAAALAALLGSLRRRGRLTAPRALVALALCVYLAGVVANTVFPIYLDKPVGDASWTSQAVLVPFADYEVADALMNVAVFVPLGILLALVLERSSWWRPVVAAAGVSLVIEVVQLLSTHLLGSGHVADVNDLLWNVVGGAAGVAVLAVAARVPVTRGHVERFRWDAAPAPAIAADAEPSRRVTADAG
ncbi:VanZ family protein [Cellulomonas sp. PS-H5]|uniref:VanZ family protein n=1 Tax=Cellulomonas sp. PS-H5 TaxID=2820400 RepID=UPI001C50210B|nr:VanZ family protein [Cellulomonas sp. PS-H5]MBW0252873.1 VanZ family protein [Cellulomonas sp. PS-H5]